jgi:hypothetical protein
MIRVVHPGSRIRILTFYPSRIPDPGVKRALGLGSGSATLLGSKLIFASAPPLYLDLGEVYNNIREDVVLWVTNLVQHLFPNCSQADDTAYKTLP